MRGHGKQLFCNFSLEKFVQNKLVDIKIIIIATQPAE